MCLSVYVFPLPTNLPLEEKSPHQLIYKKALSCLVRLMDKWVVVLVRGGGVQGELEMDLQVTEWDRNEVIKLSQGNLHLEKLVWYSRPLLAKHAGHLFGGRSGGRLIQLNYARNRVPHSFFERRSCLVVWIEGLFDFRASTNTTR